MIPMVMGSITLVAIRVSLSFHRLNQKIKSSNIKKLCFHLVTIWFVIEPKAQLFQSKITLGTGSWERSKPKELHSGGSMARAC